MALYILKSACMKKFSGKLLRVFLLLLLTTYYLLQASPAFAQNAQPPDQNPEPCKNAVSADDPKTALTNNFLNNKDGDPPSDLKFTLTKIGKAGDSVSLSRDVQFTVDFSQLQAIFGAENSDYLEGKFQDQAHQNANLTGSSPTELNNYFGSLQKTAPKVMTDNLKINYINYVSTHPHLLEAKNTISDVNGQNPKTIYDMVTQFGSPKPTGQDQETNTWGKYWAKIPVAYNEFYEGKLELQPIVKASTIASFKNGQICPIDTVRTIRFIMPDFFRTAAISGQTNQIMVPKIAQNASNNIALGDLDNSKSLLAQFLEKCFKLATENPLIKNLTNIIKVSMENLNPVKTAYAQSANNGCFTQMTSGKNGSAPYCALPDGQLQSGDTCNNKDDLNKLDKNNGNVICTFNIHWEKTLTIGSSDWDQCAPPDPNDPTTLSCTVTVAIYPNFRIPWVNQIWNNTVYSQDKKPGAYSFFIPNNTVDQNFNVAKLTNLCTSGNQAACSAVSEITGILNENCPNVPTAGLTKFIENDKCSQALLNYKLLSGQTNDPNGLKIIHIGSTDCSESFTRNFALMPKALQDILGTADSCNLTKTAVNQSNATKLNYYIRYGDRSITFTNIGDNNRITALANEAFPDNNIGVKPGCPNGCWTYVYNTSFARGISPLFAITIWWEEGGFGGKLADGSRANSEFGCFPGGNTNQKVDFMTSFNCFLDFTAQHPYNPQDPKGSFTEWMRYFCGPQADPICSNNPRFITNLKTIYSLVAPGRIVNDANQP